MNTSGATCMADLVEQLGAEVAVGTLTRDEAVQRIVEFADGGYTRLGAEEVLSRAATFRGDMQRLAAEVRDNLERVRRAIAEQEGQQ